MEVTIVGDFPSDLRPFKVVEDLYMSVPCFLHGSTTKCN